MDEKIFFILLVIFLVTSDFYLMIRNIIYYGICLFIIMYLFKIINPNISNKIKSFLNSIINTDETSIIKILSLIIKNIKSMFNVNKLIDDEEINRFSEETPVSD